METTLAKKMAEELLEQHGIHSWIVVFDNAVTRKGETRYRKQEISLSKPLTERNPIEQVRNTILHEIAHVLTQGHGHDDVWRAKALEIGCTGQTCTPVINKVPGKYSLKCTHCGEVFNTYYRRPKVTNHWHLKCGRVAINKLEIIPFKGE